MIDRHLFPSSRFKTQRVGDLLEVTPEPFHTTEAFAIIFMPKTEQKLKWLSVPALIDPNRDGAVLWESGSIIEYLTDVYDTDKKLTPSDFRQRYKAKQWLAFPISGQGPYFGQAVWFARFHSEDLPTAKDRYVKKIQRVTKVLDTALQGKQWLWVISARMQMFHSSFGTTFLHASTPTPMLADENTTGFAKCQELA